MHSAIYQITTSPVSEDDFISECDFIESSFVGNVAESVSDDRDRDEEIKNLRDLLEKNKIAVFNDDYSFTVLPGGRNTYFADKYAKFLQAVKNAAGVSLEEFANDRKCSDLVYQIKSSYCDKFNLYVSSDEFDTIPLDEFIRKAEPGARYYFGGVIGYRW